MRANKEYSHWQELIDVINRSFKGRPTRLGLFERADDIVSDYWIESGLPFAAISLDSGSELPALEIELERYQHKVEKILRLAIKLSASGEEDGLDILDADGQTTVLRFEEP
jgi:hypothetical protein